MTNYAATAHVGLPVQPDEAFALHFWLDEQHPEYMLLTDTADDGTLMVTGLQASKYLSPVQENLDMIQDMWFDLVRVLATIREK